MKNNYLIKNLNNLMDITSQMRECQSQFIAELIHSSFLIAYDGGMEPIIISFEDNDYALIFSSPDEFIKAFPNRSSMAGEFDLTTLVEVLNDFTLDGFILNVSTQSIYMTHDFFESLNDLPSNLISSNNVYTSEELKELKDSIDNSIIESFIKTQEDYMEFFDLMSSTVLFALVESDNDMNILETTASSKPMV